MNPGFHSLEFGIFFRIDCIFVCMEFKKIFSARLFRAAFSFALSLAVLRLFLFVLPFPELSRFEDRDVSTRVFDRNGSIVLILPLGEGLRREFVPISEIPKDVRDGFVDAEDRRFFLHFGVDLLSVARAAFQNVSGGRKVSGASTITMQLARMVSPSERRDFPAKIKDSVNAVRIEGKLSKKRILELYLNNVPFGKNCEGVATTARTFYGKELSELTSDEISILASIPRNPSARNRLEKSFKYPFGFPHYVRYLKNSGAFDRKGRPGRCTLPSVSLSVDSALQNFASECVVESLARSGNSRITNAAAFVCDSRTGDVLAWVGSEGWDDHEGGGQLDGVLNRVQPGSSMKPFLYALALDCGFLPTDILDDVPKEFGDRNLYIPQNFNNRFNGPVRFRVALASSLNIPAVTLLDSVGVGKYLSVLDSLGFSSLVEDGSGAAADLGLALGAGEVTLRELCEAFRVFVCDGLDSGSGRRVYSSDTARIICSILSDKNARSMGFGYSQTFETDYPAIFKTGTANQYQSIVALGATRNFCVGVWMGNFSGNTVVGKTGSSLPAYAAKSILDYLERGGRDAPGFDEPEGFVKRKVCSVSGKLPCEFCSSTVLEYVPKDGAEEKVGRCTWHKRNGLFLPSGYQSWLSSDAASIDYGSEPLRITSPKSGGVYYFDESRNRLRQFVRFEAVGGDDGVARVLLDGEEISRLERPFMMNMDATRGEHVVTVECAGETDSVEFSVK